MDTWQMCNYLRQSVPACVTAVMLNVDETCVPYFDGDQKGNVVVRKHATCQAPPPRSSAHGRICGRA